MKKSSLYLTWALQILCAIILLQTLFFKFTGAAESVYIFDKVGLGAAGRIGTGIAEMITGILLLIPAFAWLGAILGIGLMSGAIVSHLTILGIEIQGDGGYLFFLALVVFTGCFTILYLRRKQIPVLGARLK
jgi:uncharacterized membrane protein YphA (DoxX/SURF4 family)